MSCPSQVLSSWCASFSSLPRPVSFGQTLTFPMPLCHLFVVPSLHAWLGAVPTVAQPAALWGRRHANAACALSICCGFDAGTFKGQAAAPRGLPGSTSVYMSSQPLAILQRDARGQGAGQGFEEVPRRWVCQLWVQGGYAPRLFMPAVAEQLSWHGHLGAQLRHSTPSDVVKHHQPWQTLCSVQPPCPGSAVGLWLLLLSTLQLS